MRSAFVYDEGTECFVSECSAGIVRVLSGPNV